MRYENSGLRGGGSCCATATVAADAAAAATPTVVAKTRKVHAPPGSWAIYSDTLILYYE